MEIVQVIRARKNDPDYQYDADALYGACHKSGQALWKVATELIIGTEKSAQEAICTYLTEHGCDADICAFVRSVPWCVRPTKTEQETTTKKEETSND